MIEAPDPLLAGEVMASGHLDWPVRSAFKKHVAAHGASKSSSVLRRQDGRLHGRQLRSSVTGRLGVHCKGVDVFCSTLRVAFVSLES